MPQFVDGYTTGWYPNIPTHSYPKRCVQIKQRMAEITQDYIA